MAQVSKVHMYWHHTWHWNSQNADKHGCLIFTQDLAMIPGTE